MEVSGQLHAPAALTRRKKPPLSIGWEAGLSSFLAYISKTSTNDINELNNENCTLKVTIKA
jgi:hypothetical protein